MTCACEHCCNCGAAAPKKIKKKITATTCATCMFCKPCKDGFSPYECVVLVPDGGEPMPIFDRNLHSTEHVCEEWVFAE